MPWELIAVDNGSTDGTASYLAGVRDMAAVPVTIVSNPRNVGFPAAINQRLRAARGEYLVLLNNDVVVTDGWLDQLIALVNAERGGHSAEGLPGKWRSKVGAGAGSGDSRPTLAPVATRRPGDWLLWGLPPWAVRELGARVLPGLPPEPSVNFARVLRGLPADPPSGRGGTLVGGSLGVGLVGPMSNYAAPPQLVEGVPYRDMIEMHEFAARWRDEHRGAWFTVPKLSGFCLLMKRVVYDKIGGLDERFGLGFFDDDDLAERARRAGFELAVAHDLFVHHFGSRTFAGNGIDAAKILDENAERFAHKWGMRGTSGRRVALQPWTADSGPQPDGTGRLFSPGEENLTQSRKAAKNANRPVPHSNGDLSVETPTDAPATEQGASIPNLSSSFAPLRLCVRSSSSGASGEATTPGERASVSLTMIVKDEEKNLSTCLGSVRGVFDEIVVVDTGSTDRTIEIARSFGAKVFEFAWVDSFAAARNEALSHATGDYTFWLDADDVVEPVEREKLQALLAGLRRFWDSAALRGIGRPDGQALGRGHETRAQRWAVPQRGARRRGGRTGDRGRFSLIRPSGTLSSWGRGGSVVPDPIRGRLCRALRLRFEPRRGRRQDRRRSCPALSITRRCPLDVPRSRADLVGTQSGPGARSLDRANDPAHRLRRRRPANA